MLCVIYPGLGSNGPKFVRLGRTVHPKLLEFSLDELVQAEAEGQFCVYILKLDW